MKKSRTSICAYTGTDAWSDVSVFFSLLGSEKSDASPSMIIYTG